MSPHGYKTTCAPESIAPGGRRDGTSRGRRVAANAGRAEAYLRAAPSGSRWAGTARRTRSGSRTRSHSWSSGSPGEGAAGEFDHRILLRVRRWMRLVMEERSRAPSKAGLYAAIRRDARTGMSGGRSRRRTGWDAGRSSARWRRRGPGRASSCRPEPRSWAPAFAAVLVPDDAFGSWRYRSLMVNSTRSL
jgi:hypothetical protein